eukprot:584034-Amphidinium_carterae.1
MVPWIFELPIFHISSCSLCRVSQSSSFGLPACSKLPFWRLLYEAKVVHVVIVSVGNVVSAHVPCKRIKSAHVVSSRRNKSTHVVNPRRNKRVQPETVSKQMSPHHTPAMCIQLTSCHVACLLGQGGLFCKHLGGQPRHSNLLLLRKSSAGWSHSLQRDGFKVQTNC